MDTRNSLLDDWHAGERHLHYTLIAVTLVLLFGIVIVPASATRHAGSHATPSATLLAERYVGAASKIRGTQVVPSVAAAARRYGTSGGKACSSSVAMLHASVREDGALDQVALEHLRTRLRTYCPQVDVRFGGWLRARGIETGIRAL